MIGMTGTILRGTAPLLRTAALLLAVSGGLAACGALDVSDPTAIEEGELNDARGAELLRGAALKTLSVALDDAAYFGGLLADEFVYEMPPWESAETSPDGLLDRRESVAYERLVDVQFAGVFHGAYTHWQELRRAASVALAKLQVYAPAPARVGEMFALRGLATLRLAEDYCPGFPLHEVVDGNPVFSPPVSTEAALAQALADFDSAVAAAADSARILHLAQVGRARTLLAIGRFAEAKAAVEGVPTAYLANAEYVSSADPFSLENGLAFTGFTGTGRSVADQEGGTGLDFITANDPRVRLDTLLEPSAGVAGIYRSAKYPTPDAPIVLTNGIEARLIEAEAALRENPGDPQWLAILNTLRTGGGVAGLAPLADPGSDAARVDLLFRERAFWLFATGHRLADLRRLIRVYGRPAESVFPTGAYREWATYGSATSIPFPAMRETPYNPAVTGCTSR